MEIVHVMGYTCAGKRTLIKALCDPANVELRRRFEIRGTTGRFWDQPYPLDREFDPNTLWHPVSDLRTATYDHMLHKWQSLKHDAMIDLIRSPRPNCSQRLVVLWRTPGDS